MIRSDRVKPRVRELKAYTLSPDRASVKINQNENPWDAPEAIKRETLRRMSLRAWSRYPDFVPASLHEKLAAFAGWTPEGVVAGNGSNELIQATLMVTVGERKRVLISEPTFALYRQVATVLGGEVLSVPLDGELRFDVAALRAAIERHAPDVVILCSPNNPTGCRVEEDDLESLLEASGALVVIDEAYFEFCGRTVAGAARAPRKPRGLPNLLEGDGFGGAARRLPARVARARARSRQGRAALQPQRLLADRGRSRGRDVRRNFAPGGAKDRRRARAALQRSQGIAGLAPVESHANFMVVRSSIEPRVVFSELLARDILVRDVSGYPMLSDYFRVSVGTPEENDSSSPRSQEIFGGENL